MCLRHQFRPNLNLRLQRRREQRMRVLLFAVLVGDAVAHGRRLAAAQPAAHVADHQQHEPATFYFYRPPAIRPVTSAEMAGGFGSVAGWDNPEWPAAVGPCIRRCRVAASKHFQ